MSEERKKSVITVQEILAHRKSGQAAAAEALRNAAQAAREGDEKSMRWELASSTRLAGQVSDLEIGAALLAATHATNRQLGRVVSSLEDSRSVLEDIRRLLEER